MFKKTEVIPLMLPLYLSHHQHHHAYASMPAVFSGPRVRGLRSSLSISCLRLLLRHHHHHHHGGHGQLAGRRAVSLCVGL